MKKKKLSEVSVNATTLNNQNADYYNHRLNGLGTNISALLIDDFNANLNTGFYSAGSNTPNCPVSGVLLTLINIKRLNGYVQQIAFPASTSFEFYVRSQVNSNWNSWKKITPTSI